MQLKHPEILWALLLLIIPILIHLFQLRRFKKTPFTNVAMLQTVIEESRKSNSLKKWLLLFTRLLMLAALIIAFAQPFIAKENAFQERELVIYLDNSFSMQSINNGVSLLEKAVQDILKHVDPEESITLFTNTNTFKNVTVKDIQNTLLELPFSHNQLDFDDIQLRANTLFASESDTQKNLVLVSDFQNKSALGENTLSGIENVFLIPMIADNLVNVSIDSIRMVSTNTEQQRLLVSLSGINTNEAVPLSLYDGETLIAKSAAEFDASSRTQIEFSIPNNAIINGRLEITDGGLPYDNSFFFNINAREKIKILSISDKVEPRNYLERLFDEEEFMLSQYLLSGLDYSIIDSQNVIILDNLTSIPTGLQRILSVFRQNGGSLIVIPSETSDIASYNQFLSSFFGTQLIEGMSAQKRVTHIAYDHPIYKNVFEKQVFNFQYPQTQHYFSLRTQAPTLLSFEGNDPFLVGLDGFYLFTSSLKGEISNFKSSSLIVPTFYNMALSGLQSPKLFQTLGKTNIVDLGMPLDSEQILTLRSNEEQFIPLQQSLQNKVRLTFDENPTKAGIYEITLKENPIANISFNYPRNESDLNYLDQSNVQHGTVKDSMRSLFQLLEKESLITAYWKWFVILALLLALVEVIIQKFVT